MFDETEMYMLMRFSSRIDAESAQRHLLEAGVESEIVSEAGSDVPADMIYAMPARLMVRIEDRIQAIAALERARVF
jgi:hypothetical protein